MSRRVAVVVLAAGQGRRSGSPTNKVLLPLDGRPVVAWSVREARRLAGTTRLLVVVRDDDRAAVVAALEDDAGDPDVEVVTGGRTRHESEWAALRALAPAVDAGELDVVVVHDAARPFAGTRIWEAVVRVAGEAGAALPAVTVGSLAPRDADDQRPADTLVAVQTPQAFAARTLLEAFRAADRDGFAGTDTASCVEHYTTTPVRWVDGDPRNVKITFPEDLRLAERLLAQGPTRG